MTLSRLLLRQRSFQAHSLASKLSPIHGRSFHWQLPLLRDIPASRRWAFWRGKRPQLPDATEAPEEFFSYKYSRPKLLFPAIKVGLTASLVYTGAVVATQEDSNYWKKQIMESDEWRTGQADPTWRELSLARFRATRDQWHARAAALQASAKTWPKFLEFHTLRVFVIVANSWLWSGEAKQVAYMITGLNGLVFLAWCVPRLRPAMQRHFTHDVLSRKTYTMLTSVFSHASFTHLAFNSLALISFATPTWALLQNQQASLSTSERWQTIFDTSVLFPEATPMYHFLAFFISAGLFSSFVSHAAKAIRLRMALKNLATPGKAAGAMSAVDTIRPSLGASGAIYSMVSFTALLLPHTSVSILFIPIAMPISAAVSSMVLLDVVGIIRGWKMFDHWAHLGGALFGAWAWYDGGSWWAFRKAALAKRELAQEPKPESG